MESTSVVCIYMWTAVAILHDYGCNYKREEKFYENREATTNFPDWDTAIQEVPDHQSYDSASGFNEVQGYWAYLIKYLG